MTPALTKAEREARERAEVEALVRLERRSFPDIPPAENWIRD